MNVTGSNNDYFNKEDISASHDLYQQNLNTDAIMAVAVTNWDSIRELRKSIREMDDYAKGELRKFSKVSGNFLKRISEAYYTYALLQTQISQHIMEVGAKLSSK